MTHEHKQFDADVAQLIQLVTHSIYSNKDVFLRELIANSNDAIQKAKLLAAQDTTYLGDESDFFIKVDVDTENKIITIEDSGVGMTKEEVITNIGTIAKSWTKAFVEQLKQQKDAQNELIWQFGIGFYSSFMVAEKVELETKAKDADAVLWTSTWQGSYDLDESSKTTRWTIIRLHLREEDQEYADQYRLRSLITKHANYVPVPVQMKEIEEGKEKKDGTWEQINKMTSLWSRQKSSIKEEEYQEFYTSLTFDQEKPLDTIHLHIEWAVTFKALLYIPKKLPMFGMQQSEQDYGPSLYVQNVLIMDNAKELLPVWLRFVKWVVETPDLSLNVSRELIQSSTVLAKIQKTLIKEILKSLTWFAGNEREDYEVFFEHYGRFLKEGVHYDWENKEKIASLLVFATNQSDTKKTLDEYLGEDQEERAKAKTESNTDDQENKDSTKEKSPIYYLTGQSLTQLQASPYLEQFEKAGQEVVLMDDPIDEWVVGALQTYKEHKLMSATSSDIDLSWKTEEEKKEEKKELEKKQAEEKDFLTFVQAKVGTDRLEKVVFTTDLQESVWVLVTKEWQTSAQMERMMEAMWQQVTKGKRILSLNMNHPLVQQMISTFHSDKDSSQLNDLILHTYDQAVLLEWGMIEDMPSFLKRANRLIEVINK